MKILIIYTNHHSKSFNWQLLSYLKDKLIEEGHELVVRDLYRQDFDPVLRVDDFERISSGTPPEDIAREQSFVRWADLILFIYPIWWGGMPAILKGYIDKTFSWGFAYRSNGNGVHPLLTDKKALVMTTLGQSREEYEKGMFQAMSLINSQGIFGFCGVEVVDQLYFASIHNAGELEKDTYLRQALHAVQKVAAAPAEKSR